VRPPAVSPDASSPQEMQEMQEMQEIEGPGSGLPRPILRPSGGAGDSRRTDWSPDTRLGAHPLLAA